MRTGRILPYLLACAILLAPSAARATGLNPYNFPLYTFETAHFRVHYHEGVKHVAVEVAAILEELYDIYHETYNIVLPGKTEAIVANSVEPNGWAADIINTIMVSANAFDFNLRGTHDWLRDVVTHEYAHLISISSSHKWPSWMPYLQAGYFSHPNNSRQAGDASVGTRVEALHVLPLEILPPWVFEGIAQYESSRHGADRWDSHRDMILRTLTLSDKLLPWDHMFVFAGKGDDFEKTYDHGFAMIRYIAEKYGYDKVVALLRESSRLPRLNFDRSIKAVLGITAKQLYEEWKKSLAEKYTAQLRGLGKQVYGRKINKKGYDNSWPRFSPDEKKIFFISNDDNDYSYYYRALYSYSLIDTVKDDDRIKKEIGKIKNLYSINDATGLIAFTSMKSRKSELPLRLGGGRVPDVFIDTLPPEKKKLRLHKTERQVTKKEWTLHAAFSPRGDMLACTQQAYDNFYLCLVDSAGKKFRVVYPDSADRSTAIRTMFSLEWSPDGRRIAVSYIDAKDRKIGIYDTASHAFTVLCDTPGDERDPRFNRDGSRVYFSSDRTGIFNIYRFEFATGKLERMTNVSGGAFMPDVSNDEKRLVSANYDADGYGIYLVDSLRVLEDLGLDSTRVAVRTPPGFERLSVKHTPESRYSLLPRKAMVIPTLLAEQAVTRSDNTFRGETNVKAGIVFDIFDPLAMSGNYGSDIGGYLLLEPSKLFSFVTPKGLISPKVNYDIGLFGSTRILPLPVSFDYMQRSITGEDKFWDEVEEATRILPYNLTFYDANLIVSYGKGDYQGGAKINLLGGLNRFDATLMLDELVGASATFMYNVSKGYDIGGFATFLDYTPEPTMSISPRGIYAKALGQFVSTSLIKDENSFDVSGQERYDDFRFLRGTANVKFGAPAPWFDKSALYFDIGGASSQLVHSHGQDSLPYYYEPEIWWHPGYAYYVSDTLHEWNITTGGDSIDKKLPYSRGVVSGNAVTYATLSYRFPLWPGSINKKISFLYLDRLFGVVNFIAAAGWDNPTDLIQSDAAAWWESFDRKWLKSVGAELRLDAQTFSRYPVALRLRWDWGFDRQAPVGGQRYTIGLGFSFDNWEYIESPDYARPVMARP